MQIAGAAAERGKSLAEVTTLAQSIADNVGKGYTLNAAVQMANNIIVPPLSQPR